MPVSIYVRRHEIMHRMTLVSVQTSLCVPNVPQIWGLIAGITDLSIVMENMSAFLVNTFVYMKLVNFVVNKRKVRILLYVKPNKLTTPVIITIEHEFLKPQMKKLLDSIEKCWNMMQVGPNNEILQYYAKQSRTLTIKYARE